MFLSNLSCLNSNTHNFLAQEDVLSTLVSKKIWNFHFAIFSFTCLYFQNVFYLVRDQAGMFRLMYRALSQPQA